MLGNVISIYEELVDYLYLRDVIIVTWSWSMLRLAVVVGWRVTDDRS